jgi:hypothetical protein
MYGIFKLNVLIRNYLEVLRWLTTINKKACILNEQAFLID